MRRGDREREFSAYVAARRPQLHRTAYLLCGDMHRAEDLVQTALTKLYVAWGRAPRIDNVDAYARRIIVNAHIDETRRPWRRETPGLERHDLSAQPGPDIDEARLVLAALTQLPAGQRRVVVLRYYLGLSVAETAADLGCSPGTVKSQTSRALKRLETLLAPQESGSHERRLP